MQITRVTDEKAWDEYVFRNQGSSFFHLLIWKKVIEQSFRFQPHYLCSQEQDRKITGVLPLLFVDSRLTGKRMASLPFSYVCGPLADSHQIALRLLEEGLRIAEKTGSKYFEIKADHEEGAAESLGFHASDYYRTYIVHLADPDANWRNLHKSSTQRSINKAKKDGVKIEFSETEAGLRDFWRLNLGTCRFHGIPPQPYSFLKNVRHMLVQNGLAKLVLARYQERPVAGAFFFLFKDKVYYMYGASDPKYLFCRPNHLLLWQTMLWAMENDYRVFDLGRVSQDNTGLAEFKKRWGAQEKDLYYYYWPEIRGVGATDRAGWKFRLLTGTWKRMPIWLTRKGAFLYKHLA